jgi:CDP-glycerol glycerophosphotransferase (TagB/SpsB family)
LKKLLIYILNLPLYYLSLIVPKNRNIWVFGSWFGEKYADNSKTLYEYVLENDKNIKAIWLTTSNQVLNDLKQKGYDVYYSYSIQGYYYSLIAKYIFVSTGMNDVNRYVITSKCCRVQLWHGTPLKKIQDDIQKNNFSKISNLKKIIFPFNNSRYEYLTSTSNKVSRNFKTAFSNVEKIKITGYPRNDTLFKNESNSNIVVFLPTHRGEGKGSLEAIFNSFDIDYLEKKLVEINFQLIIKLHFYDLNRISYKDTSHIKFLKDDIDIYELLSKSNMLITDYSSIYFDFLLTEKPIIFTPFDLDDYILQDRELYYEYNKVTPGPRCKDWNEVVEWIRKFKNDSSLFLEDRKNIKNLFHKYYDNKSSKRVYKMIKEEEYV